MAKLSYTELKSLVSSVVTAAKVSNGTFSVTRDNVVGLVDKIGKLVTLDTVYQIDKLSAFDGEYLSFGKTIEEWNQDLILPQSYDSTGAGALSPNDPTYRPNFYSYTIGRKVIKTTLRNNDIERAVHFMDQFIEITSLQVKRLSDSMAAYRYQVKREMLARFCDLVEACYAAGVAVFATATAYTEGTLLKDNATPTEWGIVVKAIPSSPAIANWAAAKAGGYIIVYSLKSELAQPTDDSTGEAFIEEVKKVVEQAGDLSEGNSLNGNTLGGSEEAGLVLVCKQKVFPALRVKTIAGAFNKEQIAIPAQVVVIPDFGDADDDIYAMLVDRRIMRLHNTYRAVRENMNGQGDFLNYFFHSENTAHVSRNCYVKVYMVPQS